MSTPVEDDRAIIHMIKYVSELEDWQVGKTEFHAFYYINDMMEIFDALEWNNGDIVNLSGDFDFRIDIYRPLSELDEFEKFFDRIDGENEKDEETKAEPEETKAEDTEAPEDTPEDRKLAVQYLINYKDRVINMRFSDYSAQKFDVYAEMSESEMKMIILCLKYYFGPSR